MRKKYFAILLVFLCTTKAAKAVDCGPSEVAVIQVQTTDVLVRLKETNGSVWKSLGLLNDISTKAHLSIAQQAMATNSKIYLRYATDYNCLATVFGTKPQMIRIVK